MKQASFGSLGTPPVFDIPTSDPNYWSLRADYQLCVTLENLASAGIQVLQAETTDYDDLITDITDFKDEFLLFLQGMPDTPDDADPTARGLPAVPGATWTSIASRVTTLAVAGAAGGVPGLLMDIGVEIAVELFAQWLGGKVFPAEAGTLNEVVKVLRKGLLWDPGIADFERSVFVGEKGGTGLWGLFEGDKISIGQLLLKVLTMNEDDENVFVAQDVDGNPVSLAQTLFTALIDSANDSGSTVNYSMLRRILEGFELSVDVEGSPVKVSFQGTVVEP